MNKYIYLFLISMVPLIELRGGMLVATAPGTDYNFLLALIICIIGNMLPVPIIYFFARKVLIWGADKKIIGKFFTFCLEKGEKAGDMDIIVAAFAKLPPGQLKKVLTEDMIAVLKKYGVEID